MSELLGILGRVMSSHLFYYLGDYLVFIYVFLALSYFLVLLGFRPTLCVSFSVPK